MEAVGICAADGALVQSAAVAGLYPAVPGYGTGLRRAGDPANDAPGKEGIFLGPAALQHLQSGDRGLSTGVWGSGSQATHQGGAGL